VNLLKKNIFKKKSIMNGLEVPCSNVINLILIFSKLEDFPLFVLPKICVYLHIIKKFIKEKNETIY